MGHGARAPPPPKKKSRKIFFGQMSCKIRAFSGKYQVNFGNFVNFYTYIFREKRLAPQKS